jgi:hypothetical protein
MKPLAKVAKYFVLALSALCGVGLIFFFYTLYEKRDPQGDADSNCIKMDLPSVSNGFRMLATGHYTVCDYGIIHGDEETYLYVHRSEEADSRNSLVFRFGNHDDLLPEVVWANPSSLRISVDTVNEVTKQVDSVDGVKISYTIGKERVARGTALTMKRYAVGAMSILLVIFASISWASVRSLLKDEYPRP